MSWRWVAVLLVVGCGSSSSGPEAGVADAAPRCPSYLAPADCLVCGVPEGYCAEHSTSCRPTAENPFRCCPVASPFHLCSCHDGRWVAEICDLPPPRLDARPD